MTLDQELRGLILHGEPKRSNSSYSLTVTFYMLGELHTVNHYASDYCW